MKKNYAKLFLLPVFLTLCYNLSAQIVKTQSISCPGSRNGQLEVILPNGASCEWTLPDATTSTSAVLKGLGAGTYSVQVTDGISNPVYSYDLQEPAPIVNTPSITSNTKWTIAGSETAAEFSGNGEISLSTSGGSGWFTYMLKDSVSRAVITQTSPVFSTLPSGTYFLRTTDIAGCLRLDTLRVPDSPAAAYKQLNDEEFTPDTTACYKSTTTADVKPDTTNVEFPVEVYFDGKLAKKIYGYFNPGDDSTMFFSDVTKSSLTEAEGYRFTDTVYTTTKTSVMYITKEIADVISEYIIVPDYDTITSKFPPAPYPAGTIDKYKPDADGNLLLDSLIIPRIHAGKDSINARQMPTATSVSSEALRPGFHIMHMITANGKGFRYSWDVDSVVAPVSVNFTQVNNKCFGDEKGEITLFAQGSYQNYDGRNFTYRVTKNNVPVVFSSINQPGDPAAKGIKISAAAAGDYLITATDPEGCVGRQTISITQPDEPISVYINLLQETKCPYSRDGELEVRMVHGAVPPIQYSWNGGAFHTAGSTASGLQAGKNTLVVRDANGCEGNDEVEIPYAQKACFYNIVTPNGDGYNDYFDLTDICQGLQMKAVIFNNNGKLVATLDENNPKWDANDSSNPPTGMESTYTCFVQLFENGAIIGEFGESFSVVYQK
ncbi:MAG: T9SS type B sorting domain-containing protein [Prevotellaceae bacterium]|jgi:gliding motility-associated-like protein|nr:T9SS type B sorting domain-containing protein [Prevotellaceae bacterium]